VVDIAHNIAAMQHYWAGAQVGNADPKVKAFVENLDQQLDDLIKKAADKCDRMEWDGVRPDPGYKP